ncbi:membrane alanyl aminopeptidase-like [Aricia agestis]|uniref:membrane alanyl aminopeptidase-like n=1 Tax=Aricia agestis TaxID=91739 RepID=UPI001C203B1D|nr:membrane alanyl aminopeptidase-like [Aricia agestis]
MGTLHFVYLLLFFIPSIVSLPLKYESDHQENTPISSIEIIETPAVENIESTTQNENVTSTTSDADSEILSSSLVLSSSNARNQIRPGMVVERYDIEISVNPIAGSFDGHLTARVNVIDQNSREDPILFYVGELNIRSVLFSFAGGSVFYSAEDFNVDEGLLEIVTGFEASLYTFIIEYTGSLEWVGTGLFYGSHGNMDYIAMNLHPTNARRVFPCMDEPTEASTISFTFNNMEYNNMISNSLLMDNSQTQFRPLQGPPHLWGMIAHNFQVLSMPTANVFLYGRQLTSNQESQGAVAINNYYHALNEWTNKPFLEIVVDQTESLNVIALPDVDREWYSLSTVCIWEPYVLMELSSSVKQRKEALVAIAEAMARQWFGYVIYPENWRYQWIIKGLGVYVAYDIVKEFQSNPIGVDESLLDMNTIFVTDVIQESLYFDAYTNAQVLEPSEDIFEEEDIRFHLSDVVNVKAASILWMLRLMLGGPDQDFIQTGARALINQRSLQTVNTFNFVDAINSEYTGGGLVGDILEFFDNWLYSSGYPLIHVGLLQNGVLIFQERFGFSNSPQVAYQIPVTYTTSVNPNFENIYPILVTDTTTTFNFFLDEEDWVLFNIQGQGYYRVNYDNDLWERIIEALEDPERREQIHPLNRATLVDDALNLARAGKTTYEIAFRVVLTMEHEMDYAVWKAFVRNMEFLKKNFDALFAEDEERDPDIYLRMVRRTVGLVEREIGFYPDISLTEPAMTSLTRGLVMEHACRARYQPCIAAAVDWFYDPNNNEVVNPNIPYEIRPAVYCTMVKEGGDDAILALYARLEIEASLYERVVILESLACSQDDGFINGLLEQTIAMNSPYNAEERLKIFAAVAKASHENALNAFNFLSRRVIEIRNMYGGPHKLEQAIAVLSECMVGPFAEMFHNFVNSILNNLEDSGPVAERYRDRVNENERWWMEYLEVAYEWIDENDAPTMYVSAILITVSVLVALFNN